MVKLSLILAGALAAVLSAAALLTTGSPPATFHETDVAVATVERGEVRVDVQLLGELDSAHAAVVSSPLPGDQAKIIWMIAEGAQVTAGDVVVRFDPTPYQRQLEEQEEEYQRRAAAAEALQQLFELEKRHALAEIAATEYDRSIARLELRKLRYGDGPLETARLEAASEDARTDFEQREHYLKQITVLAEDQFASQAEVRNAGRTLEGVTRRLEIATKQLDAYTKHVLPSLLEMAEGRVARMESRREEVDREATLRIAKAEAERRAAAKARDRLERRLGELRDQLKGATLRAPNAGLVVYKASRRGGSVLKPRVGDRIWQNEPIVYIPDISAFVIHTQVRERDLHWIEKGKPASVNVAAFPQLQLAASVRSIGVLAERQTEGVGRSQGGKYFDITLDLAAADPSLRPGMTCDLVIHCYQQSDALRIPLQSVFQRDDETWCYVRQPNTNGAFVRQPITVGAIGSEFAEVAAGLNVGQQVALSRPIETQ